MIGLQSPRTDPVVGEKRRCCLDGVVYTVTGLQGDEATLRSGDELVVRSQLWCRLWTRKVRCQS
jgi:hypothetical protein